MASFEEHLNSRINEAEEKGKLSDEMYQKYVQFVGALDALPMDRLSDKRFDSDIHDQFGRIMPFSKWPTKSTRARSEKIWLNYNQRLQLQQAAKDAGLEGDPEPTEDPNFLSQLLDTCVRTSMKMGGLDKATAFKHCSRQVKRYENAIRAAVADKGLPKKESDEFIGDLLKGMANGKQIDIKDMSIEDRQFIQDLKDSLTYQKPDTGIKEDLDDKDVFRHECNYYNCDNRPDSDRFHAAHTQAYETVKKGAAIGKFSDAIEREMAKLGYRKVHTGKPVPGGIPFDDRDFVIKEEVQRWTSEAIPNMVPLVVGSWIELGPPPSPVQPGSGLDDKDEFSNNYDFPSTPVQIVSMTELLNKNYDQGTVRVRLNNFNLLSLPDKSGVRWHGRPQRDMPSWYEPWHGSYYSTDLENAFVEGHLRVVDNIEEWFQSQPEK